MRIFRKTIREKGNVPGSMLALPGILLCIASLTGCAMTPRFVTAKDLLERSRSMQEALTESALEDESMAEEALIGEAYPESVSEGSGGYGDGSGAAEDAGENRTQAGAETNLPEETTDGSSDVDETDAQDAKTVEAVQEIYTPGAWYLIPGRKLTYAFALKRPAHTLNLLTCRLERLLGSYEGTWSAAVRDLSTDEKLVVNDVPMPSASIMKLFILGSLYEDIRLGRVERTEELVQRMKGMISVSSNTDANEIIRILGEGDYAAGVAHVNDYICRSGYSDQTRIYNPFQEESLILDAEHTNQTTANDTAELLERIYRREFGNRRVCSEVEQMMLESATRYKLPSALPDSVSVGNKTGETDEIENDAAVVYGPVHDYILTVFSTDWADKQQAQRRFREISAEVFSYFADEDYAGKFFPYYPEMSAVEDEGLEAVGQNLEG